MNYKPVIGLEVHVELKTKSKMFCGCSADYFGQKPNTHTCPVCLGLPGALPVPNKKAIEWCVRIGLALNCQIPLFSKFDRKNYFYPDLPKGYQISQYDKPFAISGHVILGSKATPESDAGQASMTPNKKIKIRRAHMEEDTGKLIHETINGERVSLIDFNRSGVPLAEIVTEPDFESAQEVKEYLQKLQQIIRYLEVSDADMEKGEMRLEPNISLKNVSRVTSPVLPSYKVEVKNINSFKFVERAINYEIKRQEEILNSGKTPIQETRGWNETHNRTNSQRSKEEAHDYRYFPEPDIPPIRWTENQIRQLADQIGELPNGKLNRFKKEYGLNEYDGSILTKEKATADYFEEAVKAGKPHKINPKQIANYIINRELDIENVLPAELIKTILQSSQKATIDKSLLEKAIKQVVSQNLKAVEDYKRGKIQSLGFLLGKVKQHFPNADINIIKQTLERRLKQ